MKIIIAVVLCLILLGVAGLFYLGQKSSDGEAPGLTDGRLAPCPTSPNCVSSEDGTPQDQRVDALPERAWEQIPAAIDALGGTVTREDRAYISAEFTSSIFSFTDDVEFRLADDAVHLRSASRVGRSDLGANRDRVEALREQLGDG